MATVDHRAPSAVTLDLFGTLLDFDLRRDETPLVERLLEDVETEAETSEVLSIWVRESLRDRARTPFRTVRAAVLEGTRQLARILGLELDPPRWADALEELWARGPLRPEAVRALDRLEDAGIPAAIVSNVDVHVLDQVLASTGLADRVDVVVCSEHARAYKPHPRPFRMALDRLGIDGSRCVHVGDSPGEDRAGARAAGLRSRLVDPTQPGELERVVEELL